MNILIFILALVIIFVFDYLSLYLFIYFNSDLFYDLYIRERYKYLKFKKHYND